jgi:PKD domain-containing protein
MRHTTFARYAVLGATLVAIAGCTMKKQDAPDLTGPSEMSTSITVTASPDTIPQDGATQSVVTIVARDAHSQPIANLTLRLDVFADGAAANDFGRLSARNITTGSDGRATAVYTAPKGLFGDSTPEALIRIYVTPVGTNLDNAVARSVSIRLVPPATIYAPGSPIASFTYSPNSPKAGQDVFFNASGSTDTDGSIVEYQWTYGDGDVEYGLSQTHDFPNAGTYNVILTVTDNVGNKASTTRTITVS